MKGQRVLPPGQVLAEDARRLGSVKAVADQYSVSAPSVYAALARAGISVRDILTRRPDRITVAELRVLRVCARGIGQKAAAYELGISYQTTKNHLLNAYHKLGVETLLEAMYALGWIRIPDEDAA